MTSGDMTKSEALRLVQKMSGVMQAFIVALGKTRGTLNAVLEASHKDGQFFCDILRVTEQSLGELDEAANEAYRQWDAIGDLVHGVEGMRLHNWKGKGAKRG